MDEIILLLVQTLENTQLIQPFHRLKTGLWILLNL